MNKKTRCIYIDSIDKNGKTLVTKEIRKYLKQKEKDVYEITGTDDRKLEIQDTVLQDNTNSLILKEDSVLSLFNSHLKEGSGLMSLESSFNELIRKERDMNQRYGSVHFFILPENPLLANKMDDESLSLNLIIRCDFFRNIKQYSASQGLNIEIVLFDENDKIYDIRDKILEILEKKYTI